ncbi:MAG: MFS transporter [Bacillota bacterium]|nr:MFS transporter [Bacillota bacterium]
MNEKANKNFSYIMYALGYLGISIFIQTTVKWYQYFYTPPGDQQQGLTILVPISLIGLAMIIARLFDGLADPIVAYLSDKNKGKGGRRIPFILYGSLPLAITFILLWFPPVQQESMLNFYYLATMLCLFFIFFTIVTAPYLALIGELSRTRKDRINLTMIMGVTQIIGVMVAEAGSGLLISFYGYQIMGLVLGLVALLMILLTPIFVRENPADEAKLPTVSLFSSMRLTLTNNQFIYYLLAYGSVWFGINTLTIAMPYIYQVLLHASAESSGIAIALAFVVALAASPVVPRLVLKYGKKEVLFISSVFFAIILMLTGLFGTFFTGIASMIIVALAGFPLAVIFIVPNAMVADIAEIDARSLGQQREGMFFGAQGLIIKLVVGLSSFITPLVFRLFGYSLENPLGLQLIGPFAGVIILVNLFWLSKYSLSQ